MQYVDGHVSPGLFGPVIRVGWLGPACPGGSGDARECLPTLQRLVQAASVAQTRGWHMCHFCRDQHARQTPITRRPAWYHAELVVPSRDGQVFSVPNLILHYIDAHHSRPPQDFVDACMADPSPFGLTPAQIVDAILGQDQDTLTALQLGTRETWKMQEFLEFFLGEIFLDARRYGPDATRGPRNRWRNVALVELFANPYAGRDWLYGLINRLDPAITRGVQQLWLQETQGWAVASTVFPVAATASYEDPSTVTATRTTGD
jgi:hypothetical protein